MTRTRRRALLWIVGGGLAVAAYMAAAEALPSGPATAQRRPTARVVRGALKLDVWTTGEFRSTKLVSLGAPPAGGGLRIIRLVETGTAVTAGDVVMEFDPAEQLYALEQSLTELDEADQNVIRRRADTEARDANDKVALLNARYQVRRAELDSRIPERLVAANDYRKRILTLEEMKRRLVQTERDIEQNQRTRAAALVVIEQGRKRVQINADRARQIIESLVVRSPIDGLVLVKENRDATGGVFFSGMSLPEYRTGDTVSPGRSIVDVSDTSDMEIRARVNEQERTTLAVGQSATVTADGLPGQTFSAKISALSGVALRSPQQAGPLRQFEVFLRLEKPDPRLRPGTTVRITIAGTEIRNVLTIPKQAVFQRNGEPTVYVRAGGAFEARVVKVTNQSENRTAIKGLPEGAEVALASPAAESQAKTPANGPTVVNGGRR